MKFENENWKFKGGSYRLYKALGLYDEAQKAKQEEKRERTFIISNAKVETFKAFCRDMRIDTICKPYDKKNKFFSCLMSEDDFVEAKAFCDEFCKPKMAESKYKPKVICIIIEETCQS